MKKKLVGVLLSAAMVMSSLAACGGDEQAETPAADTQTEEPAAEEPAAEEPAAEGTGIACPDVSGWDASKEIYVYSWNQEFGNWLAYVIGPTDADGNSIVAEGQEAAVGTGLHPELAPYVHYLNLGVSGTDGTYQTDIDTALTSDKYPSIIPADESVAKYYSENDDVTMNLADLGFTSDMLADAYQYTIDYSTYNGNLKALCLQATPGVICYRTDIAEEALGTSDPDEVQAMMSDWDGFFEVADKVKAAGYKMCSGSDEMKYPIVANKANPWVTVAADGSESLTLDNTVNERLEIGKKLYDGGYTNNNAAWSEGWNADMNGDVFCYAGCTWFVPFTLGAQVTEGTETWGKWHTIPGPVSYYWGGTYAMVGKDTPNPELCAYLMYELHCDSDMMYNIFKGTNTFVNNKVAVSKVVGEGFGAMDLLGGQNPVESYAAAAEKISLKNSTYLDNAINAFIDEACEAYNAGTIGSVDEGVDYVKNKVKTSYDYITVE